MIPAKQMLSSWSDGTSWFGSNYTLNLYKGCSHGCIYCDSRSDCYGIENFDQVKGKENALEILHAELSRKRRKGIVASGAMGDPYNPWEKSRLLTRGSLELLNRHGFGASLLTKSDLAVRDIDLLSQISSHSPVVVKFTITTADDELCSLIEPNVVPTSKRFAALRELSRSGIFTGVMLWPLLPFINDNPENISQIVEDAAASGAKFISPYFGLTLRQNQRLYFYKQLDLLFPGLKELYIKVYGNKYECLSPNYRELMDVLQQKCSKHGLMYRMSQIRAAITSQNKHTQISLFD